MDLADRTKRTVDNRWTNKNNNGNSGTAEIRASKQLGSDRV